jgi:sugar phosphate isomerase/epimerase
VLKALKVVGYKDWMTIESFAQPEPELAEAAAVWRDTAPSGDELAQQGLRFIRSLARGLGVK